jgi:hypothetical protein
MTKAEIKEPILFKYKKHTHISKYYRIHVNSNPVSDLSNLVDVNHGKVPTGSRLYDP